MSTESETPATLQPSSRQVRIKKVGDDLELSYRKLQGCVGCFLLVWLTGWTGGCIMLVREAISDPSFRNILCAVPFLASWFFVFSIMVWMLFGVERVRLGFEGLEYRVTALVTLSRRWVPRTELKKVRAGMAVRSVGDPKQGEQPCLKFETLGRPIEFACGIRKKEQRWLVEWLNEYLDALGLPEPQDKYGTGREEGITTDPRVGLLPSITLVEPPSDTRIECRQYLDTIEFVWRGGWSLKSIAFLTFFNLFWNGILGMFICKQDEYFDWSAFIFLIPHGIIGLCIFGIWLAALTAPLWRLTWTFGEREATRRVSISDENAVVYDLGRDKRFDVQPPVRIESRRREGKEPSGSPWWFLSHPDGEYSVVFIGGEDEELLRIDRLTEGDARWIADVLMCAFPSWQGAAKREGVQIGV
jgi:hypothetical protein